MTSWARGGRWGTTARKRLNRRRRVSGIRRVTMSPVRPLRVRALGVVDVASDAGGCGEAFLSPVDGKLRWWTGADGTRV